MFARFKTADGKEINVVPYLVIALAETDDGTAIYTEGGITQIVVGSIRQVRSTLTRVGQAVSASDGAETEASDA